MNTPGQVANAAKAQSTAILGSSLSAIDVAVTLACHHGRFVRDGEKLRYEGARDWHATMLSDPVFCLRLTSGFRAPMSHLRF
jgi:hypothetical protein